MNMIRKNKIVFNCAININILTNQTEINVDMHSIQELYAPIFCYKV